MKKREKIEFYIRLFEQENLENGGNWGAWAEMFPYFKDPYEGGSALVKLLKNYPPQFVIDEKGRRKYERHSLSSWSDLLPMCTERDKAAQKIHELLRQNGFRPKNEPIPMQDWARILPKFKEPLIGFIKIRKLMGYSYFCEIKEEKKILREEEDPEDLRTPWVFCQELVPRFKKEERFSSIFVMIRLKQLKDHFQQYGQCQDDDDDE